jgi:hypothetical protein
LATVSVDPLGITSRELLPLRHTSLPPHAWQPLASVAPAAVENVPSGHSE